MISFCRICDIHFESIWYHNVAYDDTVSDKNDVVKMKIAYKDF